MELVLSAPATTQQVHRLVLNTDVTANYFFLRVSTDYPGFVANWKVHDFAHPGCCHVGLRGESCLRGLRMWLAVSLNYGLAAVNCACIVLWSRPHI